MPALIDKYLPRYQFSERHTVDIPAPRAAVMAAVERFRPDDDAFFRAAIGVRELPMRLAASLGRRVAARQPAFGVANFTLLEQAGDEERVLGMAGRFWQLDYGQSAVADGAAFLAFGQPGTAKLALAFATEALGGNCTRLRTETRVGCSDRASLRSFAPYWYLIRPVSGLIRRRMLSAIRRDALRPAAAA